MTSSILSGLSKLDTDLLPVVLVLQSGKVHSMRTHCDVYTAGRVRITTAPPWSSAIWVLHGCTL